MVRLLVALRVDPEHYRLAPALGVGGVDDDHEAGVGGQVPNLEDGVVGGVVGAQPVELGVVHFHHEVLPKTPIRSFRALESERVLRYVHERTVLDGIRGTCNESDQRVRRIGPRSI
ncbi:hypothetical protein AVEN_213043-1 [Araneus ventricosus]|uniref:Uncharacterized protein n=1 Tax=Araneus ventricosus TaxID=182803 RepID=A0A4Y2N6J7_ARAVE|nr:hypothetical protein AVEN_213043-1 [Araneus ventricosus]